MVSHASLRFQKIFPDAVSSQHMPRIVSTSGTRSHIATKKLFQQSEKINHKNQPIFTACSFYSEFTEAEKHHVAQEMGDVLLYLVRLADRCQIDLPTAAVEKISHNANKYPADKAYGRSCKYTAYRNDENTERKTNGTGDS